MLREFEIKAVALDRLREVYPDLEERLSDEDLRNALGAVTQASNFLTRFILAEPRSLDTLTRLNKRPDEASDDTQSLVLWNRLELLRIAARDLTGLDELEAVGHNLACLGEDVLAAALRLTGTEDRLAVIAMGKLGGNELNYASDIDIMFVGDGQANDAEGRSVMEIARQCFRVDANLRPEGRDGVLVRTLQSYQRYWAEHAQTWEFQALLKARPVVGSDQLQQAWACAATETLWTQQFGADQLRALREMKARVESIMARKGLSEREVKRGRGGIRDIEFAVQLLQLVHGGADTHVRSPTTLTALEQLSDGGYVAAEDAAELRDSYRFLRTLEHRLQLVEEEQTHTIPNSATERSHLAYVLGYSGDDALSDFEADLRERQISVRYAHEKLYFRPLLEAFASGAVEPGSTVETQLAAFGFADANRTRTAVVELTRGLARSSRLMQQMMPLLFDWLSSSPDSDEGLLGLRKLIAGFRTPTRIINVFRDSPEVARRLCLLLGSGRIFAREIPQHPEVLDDLGNDALLVPAGAFIDRMRVALGWRQNDEERHDALIRLARAERLRILCADVLGLISDSEASTRRSALADAVLELTLEVVLPPPLPVALIAMGRYGGNELGYASDLDLIVVHDGRTAEDQVAAEQFAQQLIQSVGSSSPLERIYDIDYDLRPEGRKGSLSRSIISCVDYYANWADTWERQALIRARFAAGSQEVAQKFFAVVEPFVWAAGVDPDARREIRHLKARMERERIPRGGDPEFHLKLGRGSLSDVEWTVQLLQLEHGVRGTNTLQALNDLLRNGFIGVGDARMLDNAWRFCDFTRNRLFIVCDASADALPANLHTLSVLARSLEIPELRDRYKQVTRRCRNVTERLFYGQED